LSVVKRASRCIHFWFDICHLFTEKIQSSFYIAMTYGDGIWDDIWVWNFNFYSKFVSDIPKSKCPLMLLCPMGRMFTTAETKWQFMYVVFQTRLQHQSNS
jgi:hypothetical protein